MRVLRFISGCAVGAILWSPALPAAVVDSPFTIEIAAVADSVKGGSVVDVEVTVTNTSAQSIQFIESSPLCDYQVDVTNERGEFAPETEQKGKSKCEGGRAAAGGFKVVRLEPKEVWHDEIEINQFADMGRPATYSVQISRKVPKWLGAGVVKSNKISITVVGTENAESK